jgi:hypothetical protein
MQTRDTKLFITLLKKTPVNMIDQELFSFAQKMHYQYAIFFIKNMNLKLNMLPLNKVFAYPELQFAQGHRDRLKTAILKENPELFLEMLQKIDHENICLDNDTFEKARSVSSKAYARFFIKNLNSVYNGFGLYSRKIPKIQVKKTVYFPRDVVVKNTSTFARERKARKERLAKLPVIKAIKASKKYGQVETKPILFPIKKSPIKKSPIKKSQIKKAYSLTDLASLKQIKLEPLVLPAIPTPNEKGVNEQKLLRPVDIMPFTKPEPMPMKVELAPISKAFKKYPKRRFKKKKVG